MNPLDILPTWFMAILSLLPALHYGRLAKTTNNSLYNSAMAISWLFIASSFVLFQIGASDLLAFRFNARASVALLSFTTVIETAANLWNSAAKPIREWVNDRK
jgi:hypothetical protein